MGIQLAPVSSGCAAPLSSLSPCKLFLDPGTAPCFAPRRVHLSPYTPLTAPGLKLALRASASPVQIHPGPSICLAWTAGICRRLLLGTVICRAKRPPREPLLSRCIFPRACLCMFARGMGSEKRWQVLAPVRVFVLERSGSRHAAKHSGALAERSECPFAAGT